MVHSGRATVDSPKGKGKGKVSASQRLDASSSAHLSRFLTAAALFRPTRRQRQSIIHQSILVNFLGMVPQGRNRIQNKAHRRRRWR